MGFILEDYIFGNCAIMFEYPTLKCEIDSRMREEEERYLLERAGNR
jgi:hypothetical protein